MQNKITELQLSGHNVVSHTLHHDHGKECTDGLTLAILNLALKLAVQIASSLYESFIPIVSKFLADFKHHMLTC